MWKRRGGKLSLLELVLKLLLVLMLVLVLFHGDGHSGQAFIIDQHDRPTGTTVLVRVSCITLLLPDLT